MRGIELEKNRNTIEKENRGEKIRKVSPDRERQTG
jgi:hypothetical protein